MPEGAAKGAHGDDSGQQTLVVLENFEARFRPKLAAVPVEFRAETAQASDGGGLMREILETQAREGGAIGERGGGQREQGQCDEKADPKKTPALYVTHVTAPPGRRWPRSCRGWCFE